jgi:hypothetical protein
LWFGPSHTSSLTSISTNWPDWRASTKNTADVGIICGAVFHVTVQGLKLDTILSSLIGTRHAQTTSST